MIGTTELIILGILAIFLFGAKRIPELARNLGRAKGEFHAGISDVTSPSRAEIDMDRGGVSDDVANENEYFHFFLFNMSAAPQSWHSPYFFFFASVDSGASYSILQPLQTKAHDQTSLIPTSLTPFHSM